MTRGLFTWSNNQEHPTLEKLDRILVSKDWEDLFPNSIVTKLPRDISDHNPLIISSGPSKPVKHIQFRFEISWFSNPDFIPTVQKIWDKPCNAKSSLDKIQQNLKLFKQYFKGWGFNLQGELRKKRALVNTELAVLEKLEEEVGLSDSQVANKLVLLKENYELLEQEETYWLSRSHEQWLVQRDNNTSYFHKIANGRRRKNTIISFENADTTIEGDENILKHATDYYSTLFGPEERHDIHIDSDLWDELAHVTDQENTELCKPFSEIEIKNALFQMERNKAAGPDKITIEFYQIC